MNKELIRPLVLLSADGPIVPELVERGIHHVVWGPLSEPKTLLRYIRAVLRSIRFFRQNEVKLIHVNSTNFWRPAELFAAWLLRIPIIVHYHVVNDQPSPAIKLCHATFCVSRYVAENSLPLGLKKHVIYNPVDMARFGKARDIRTELGFSKDDIVVSFLGQIRDIKGVQDFMAMARSITSPQARFLIAGECRDPTKYPGSFSEADLRAMAGGDGRIHYVGYIKQVEDIYQTSDIIVVPSRWQEPLGLINLEAGAAGKPVVATRVGGIPEVVMNGVTGFLVDANDVAGLASCVSELIESDDLRSRMGAAGLKRVTEEFTNKPISELERLLRIYSGNDF